MIKADELKQQASGRWVGALTSLGVPVREDGKHGPCPLCQGKDRFRLAPEKSGYICGQCGAGDYISLVQKYFNIDFNEALEKVSVILGSVGIDTIKRQSVASIRYNLNNLWKKSKALTETDLACKYLKSRKLNVTSALIKAVKALRFNPKCYESDSKTEIPAMVALVTGQSGKPVSVHRTYLDTQGNKAAIANPRKMMPHAGDLKGSAIRLLPPAGDLLGVAEGIETALACAQLHRIPTWSVINSSLMESWYPPEGVKRVVIFGDNDLSYTGQKSAYILANRLWGKKFKVSVEIPDLPGHDWADELDVI